MWWARGAASLRGVAGVATAAAVCCASRGDVEASPQTQDKRSSVVFLGTGTSAANPSLSCVLGLNGRAHGGCEVCRKGQEGPPHENKNVRLNPSILVKRVAPQGGQVSHVLFDCGKTFREGALRWFLRRDIPYVDAVVLTHDHADAIFGLDDLRLVQHRGKTLNVFSSMATYEKIKCAFPYLIRDPVPAFTGAAKALKAAHEKENRDTDPLGTKIKTFVASLAFTVMATPSLEEPSEHFNAAGLELVPVPVFHGPDYISLGFAFGKTKKFVYISDCSEVPERTMKELKTWDIDVLVIDTMHPNLKYRSHMSLEESLEVVRELAPRKTLLIGMMHSYDHDSGNADLAKLRDTEGLDVQLAFDGLELPLDFEI
ncbi:Putative hydrolase C777.06c [Durusdinium trenchii]|uniref:Hydrolase C777.06c n=1 Tax=Durusdinium trenchii TaxID=1381693 RepID=A0ABP0R6U6_9DINO